MKYLHGTGFMEKDSKELQELKDALSSLSQHAPNQPQKMSEPTTPKSDSRRALVKPTKHTVKNLSIGPDHQHLVAQPGDTVIVYAWDRPYSYQSHAIAYNPINQSAGRVEGNLLSIVDSESTPPYELAFFINSNTPSYVGELQWQAGDHVYICQKNVVGSRTFETTAWYGAAFNLRTLEIGQFHCPDEYYRSISFM